MLAGEDTVRFVQSAMPSLLCFQDLVRLLASPLHVLEVQRLNAALEPSESG